MLRGGPVPAMEWQSDNQRYESFAYLGLPTLLLVPLGLLILWRGRPGMWRHTALISLATGFALLAVSQHVTFGQHLLFEVGLPKMVSAPLSILYCSPRFVWPLYYLTVLAAVVGCVRLIPYRRVAVGVLVLAAVLQCAELHRLVDQRERTRGLQPEWAERAAELRPLLQQAERVETVPRSTRELTKGWDYAGVAYEASLQGGIVFHGGNVARKPWKLLAQLDAEQERRLREGPAEGGVLFVFSRKAFDGLKAVLEPRYVVEQRGGYWVAYVR